MFTLFTALLYMTVKGTNCEAKWKEKKGMFIFIFSF